MSSNSNERQVARSFGFGRPVKRIPGPEIAAADRSVANALGVRSGATVLLAGQNSSALKKGLSSTGARIFTILPTSEIDCVVYQVDSTYALRRIPELTSKLKRSGFVWILWPRGAGHISEQHVRRAAASAGFVGVHGGSVNAHLTGLKLIHSQDTW